MDNDKSYNDKSLSENREGTKSNSSLNKKKKGKGEATELVVNFKYDDYEPGYNKYQPAYKKNQGKFYYDNVDILDQNRFKFILNFKEESTSENSKSEKNFNLPQKNNNLIKTSTNVIRESNYNKYSYGVNSNLRWEDIWVVIYYSVDSYTCSICLEKKLISPVITRCGHIFCWPCIYNYNDYWTATSPNKKIPECPLCKERLNLTEIKFCDILYCVNYISCLDFKVDEKEKEKPSPERTQNAYNSLYTNHISFNLVMKNKKAPTLYNTFHDPDLEYYKRHLHQKDAFNFIPLENQEEFCFSRIFLTNPLLTLKKYQLIKADLENALKEELNLYRDTRMVNSLNMCTENIQEKITKLQNIQLIDLNSQDEELEEESDGYGCSVNIIEQESAGISQTINDLTINVNNLQTNSDTLSNNPNSDNINNSSTIDDEFLKTENSELNLKDFLYFFQEQYGDIYYLHPINYSILLAEYSDEHHLPTEINGEILEVEMHQTTPYLKNKYPFLNHLKIGSLFYFVEIDMKHHVSNHTLKNFHHVLKDRAKVRHNIKREEEHYDNYVQNIKTKEEKKITSEMIKQSQKFIRSEIFKDDVGEEINLFNNDRRDSENGTAANTELETKKENKLKNLLNNDSIKIEAEKTEKNKFYFNTEDFPEIEMEQKVKKVKMKTEYQEEHLLDDVELHEIEDSINILDDASVVLRTKQTESKPSLPNNKNPKNKTKKKFTEIPIAILKENEIQANEDKLKKHINPILSAGLKIEKKNLKDNKIITSTSKK